MLADVEKQKTRAAGDGEAAGEEVLSQNNNSESHLEPDESPKKFSKSCSQNSIDLCISELAVNTLHKKSEAFLTVGSEKSFSGEETKQKLDENEKKNVEGRQRSMTQPNLLNFITVIEISGRKKVEVPLQCPPKPPPKTFMRTNPDRKTKPVESFNVENETLRKRIGPSVPSPDTSHPEIDVTEKQKSGNKSARENYSEKEEFESNKNDASYGKIKKLLLSKTEDSILTSNGLNK